MKATAATIGFVTGILGGAAIIDATQERIQEKAKSRDKAIPIPKTKTKPKKTEYWSADIKANKIAPITYSEAQIRVATGKNIIATNQVSALKIATLYPVRRLEIDIGKEGTPGYYWHYHVSLNHNNNGIHGAPHIWFEGPKLFDY